MTSDGVASLLRFDAPPRRDWEDLVRRSLRGDSLETLVGRTADGFAIQPLYTAAAAPAGGDAAGLPGLAPFTRGGARPGRWELCQRHDLIDPAETNEAIRADIAGGVSGIWLRLRRPPAPGELLATLAGVNPAETSVVVDGGPWFVAAAEAASALAAAAPPARLVAAADPLGALASCGFLLGDLAETLASLAPLLGAARQREERNGAPAGACRVSVDAAVYCDAGAPPALELACMLATGVAYLRALEAGGLAPSQAAPYLQARLAATPDQFATISKFRAARTLWDRVMAACGVAASQRRALRCGAVTSEAAFVAQDPFVNLVRATIAAFAAAGGGAERITVLPHDIALGPPGERSRRLARNVSHLLADETHLGAVIDPAGGAWYVEDRTARLAEAAWGCFGEIEAAGGMASVLLDGSLAGRIQRAAERRSGCRASGEEHVVGVTCHPPPAGEADAGPAGSPRATPVPADAAVTVSPLPVRRPVPEEQR